ncbi:SMI1/KNR4 family protein, partial [Bacteroides ovatus]|uniref:SMI1/KNR4 family protein n=1 Tax=Bacteroides ovatus TaxID=28116 RepID=UPI0022E08BEC
MNQKKEILEKLAFIRRHKEFASFGVKEQEVSYNPCLSEEDIKGFEHKHCITLPDDYRTFISEIGNGGFGPGYGLLPLDKAIVDFKLKDKPNISLNEKFPYQDSWNEEWITSFN